MIVGHYDLWLLLSNGFKNIKEADLFNDEMCSRERSPGRKYVESGIKPNAAC